MKEKKTYLELLRIIAIIGVIFAHLPGYRLYQSYTGIMQIIYMSITMVSRMCIPLFFMISGTLLLRKEESMMIILKKRCIRIVGCIIIFTSIYYCLQYYYCPQDGITYSGKALIKAIFERGVIGLESYWYLYAYLGFLICLPFLQRAVKGMNKNDFLVLIVIHFLGCSFFPMLNVIMMGNELQTISFSADFEVPLAFVQSFVYPIIGYYIDTNVEVEKVNLKLLFAILLFTLFIQEVFVLLEGRYGLGYSPENVFWADYIYGIIVFLIVKKMFKVRTELGESRFGKAISVIGGLTFGMYLLDPFLKMFFYDGFQQKLQVSVPYIIITFIWILISMILGGAITFVLKKLPGFKLIV